jgi:glucose-1-phosphate adenylyltransferase
MKNVVALVLGGGRGTRLFPLTSIRSKPAVPLGGMYRLIDIPISNCINSNINQIFVLTQFMSVSLHRHIRRTYNFDQFSGGFVEILAAQETMSEGTDWYQGTADAVRKNLTYIDQRDVEYVVILSGDQLYRMDFAHMLREHQNNGADVSIACMPVTEQQARGFGVMRLDQDGRVKGFLEKPQSKEELDLVRTDLDLLRQRGITDESRNVMASMGIYIFNKSVLSKVLSKTNYQDFGKEVFPATIRTHKVQSYWFDGYWEDIGTIRSFYEANLSLTQFAPPFDLVSAESMVYTRARFLPPTRIGNAQVKNSLIANGCQIGDGAVIENSIIGLRTRIGENAVVRNSIIMGADFYQTPEEISKAIQENSVPIGIGNNSTVDCVIVDKNCCIGNGVTICNTKKIEETTLNHSQYVIRDGIPIIVKGAVLPSGWKLADQPHSS